MIAASEQDAAPTVWCVIGAGPSGLTALKNLLALGIEAECLEREHDLGGTWHFGSSASRVFASTRLISSRPLTEFTDFPMPRQLPWHPHHTDCLAYLRAYADHFGLRSRIHAGCEVLRVEPLPGGRGWSVELRGQPPRIYEGVVIANGHNHTPRMPAIPGDFTGRLLHSSAYVSPEAPLPLRGRRVLVIGGGNSGCDIASEVCLEAAATFHSMRRSYHVVPRTVLGRPADLRSERLLKMRAPVWLRRLISLRLIDRSVGLPHRHGLPRPDHRLWETHPVINDTLYRRIDEGRLTPVGDVRTFDGSDVLFTDGRRERIDVIIAATGYRIAIPFVGRQHLDPLADDHDRGLDSNADGHQSGVHAACTEGVDRIDDVVPTLWLNMLPAHRDDIACVGLIQPDSGQWGLTDLQSQVVARMALARRHAPRTAAWLFRSRSWPTTDGPIRYVDSPRHRLEVEHFTYRRRLERLVESLDRRLRRELG
jgi:cation diffusion facilitator CzcD-associated flavoprotein CzcO